MGFHQDADAAWVADLECGHGQHVRHEPPWQVRPWVEDEAGRAGRIGTVLDCRRCDDERQAYLDARMQGLCEEGAEEAARSRADHAE